VSRDPILSRKYAFNKEVDGGEFGTEKWGYSGAVDPDGQLVGDVVSTPVEDE